jgi:hypothetical protein
MSTWITIKNQEDLEYSEEQKGVWKDTILQEETIDVFIGDDYNGNHYVSIPVSFIIKVLGDNGYEINEKD